MKKDLKSEQRVTGYYWVRLKNDDDWGIAFYASGSKDWFDGIFRKDSDFDEINENRIPQPNENTSQDELLDLYSRFFRSLQRISNSTPDALKNIDIKLLEEAREYNFKIAEKGFRLVKSNLRTGGEDIENLGQSVGAFETLSK